MRAKTILHVVADEGLGLAARQLAILASDPDATYAHKVALLVRNPGLAAHFADARIPVFPRETAATSALLPFSFVAGRWLAELARRTHADVVHAHDQRAATVAAPLAHHHGVPFVRTVAVDHEEFHFLQRFELKRTRLFVATSEHVRRGLLRRVPLLAPKMTLICTALPEPAPRPRPLDPAPRVRLHLVGVPPHQDGVVVQALREVADLVIGDHSGDFDAAVVAGAVPLGRDADEPVELAVLRAMALGRPAIVVPGSVFAELAAPADGAPAGVVAADDSVNALVAAVQTLGPSSLRILGAAARAQFEGEHSARALRSRYRECYASVLAS